MLSRFKIRQAFAIVSAVMVFIIVGLISLILITSNANLIRTQAISTLQEHNQAVASRLDTRLSSVTHTNDMLANALTRHSGTIVSRIWQTSSNVLMDQSGLVHRIGVFAPFRQGHQTVVFDRPAPPSEIAVLSQLINNPLPETIWLKDGLSAVPNLAGWHGPEHPLLSHTGDEVLIYAMPYRGFSDVPQGVVWSEVLASRLDQILSETITRDSSLREGYSLMLSPSGEVLSHYGLNDPARTTTTSGQPLPPVELENLQELLSATATGQRFTQLNADLLDWESVLVLRTPLPALGWELVSFLPPRLIEASSAQNVLQAVVIMVIGIAAAAFYVWYITGNWITEPLHQLTRAAQEIGFGDMRYQINLRFRNREDEVGLLARALNDMRNNLEYSHNELSRWSRTLEQRVSERTRELEIAQNLAQTNAADLQAVYDASLSVVGDHQLEGILQALAERIITLLPASYAAVWLTTSDDQHLKLVASTGTDKLDRVITLNEGIVGLAVRETRPVILEDYGNWPARLDNMNPAVQQGMGVPLLFNNQPIGALMAGRRTEDPVFTEDDQRLLTLLANLVSPAVRNAQLYVRLDEAMVQTQQANDVKTHFLASVTHELRTPLNLIINNTDFMRIGEFGPVTDEQSSRLQQTVRSAEHLLYLINDLLDVSKIEAGEMHLFIQMSDPLPMLEDALDSAYSLASEKPDLEVVTDIPENLPHIPMDSRRIRQVLTNLLSNAVKFTPSGEVRLMVTVEEVLIRFAVRDTGIGIPDEEMQNLFSLFQRTTRARSLGIEGTGLGLAISRYLVEAHGGAMSVETNIGEGSTFSFTLPLHALETEDEGKRVTATMPQIKPAR
jgi:signal transduction histidine kinase/HAMP domain-containing protein